MNNFHRLLGALLPSRCILCNRAQADTTCEPCLELLRYQKQHDKLACACCGIELPATPNIILGSPEQRCLECINTPPSFDLSFCLAPYAGQLKTVVQQLKYQRRLAYATGLAHLWNRLMSKHVAQLPPAYLLPVPLSRQKLAERGFNQCWEIVKHLTLPKHLKALPNVLRRRHSKIKQISAGRLERQQALSGLFYFEPRHAALLAQQAVIVFDDVMTTGSTLNAIARVLKDHGVYHVRNWVLLRTPRQLTDV